MRRSKQNAATCDCCEGLDVLTPVDIYNRPGLDAIAFRVGIHASFLESMKAQLSSSKFPKLADLTTRESRDFSIALLDAWATVGDVLTFYQERIANEGYLRTAIERRSILELARLVGYRLRPGLSASVYLAYTLEPVQESTVIEIGNKAQSLPGPGELPQIFETAEKFVAYSGLNLMKLRLTQPQLFDLAAGGIPTQFTIFLKGASLNLRVNDRFLLQFELLSATVQQPGAYRVLSVTPIPELDQTRVELKEELKPGFTGPPANSEANAARIVKTAQEILTKYLAVEDFGLSATTSKTVKKVSDRLKALQTILNKPSTTAVDRLAILHPELDKVIPAFTNEYAGAFSRGWDSIASWLSAIITDLLGVKKSQEESGFTAIKPEITFVATQKIPGQASFVELFAPFKLPQSDQPATEAELVRSVPEIFSPRSESVAQAYGIIQPQAARFLKAVLINAARVDQATPTRETEGVVSLASGQALRLKAFLAGRSLPIVIKQQPNTSGGPAGTTTATVVSPPSLATYMSELDKAGFKAKPGEVLKFIALDAEYDQIKIGSKVVIEHPGIIGSTGTPGTIVTIHTVDDVKSSQLTFTDVPVPTTVLELSPEWLTTTESQGNVTESNDVIRRTAVFAQSEDVTLVETDLPENLSFANANSDPVIELDGLYSNLAPGRWTIISGERVVKDTRTNQPFNTGVIVSELLMVASVSHEAKTIVKGEPTELKGEKLHTFLRPATPPAYSYRRGTVKIYGNVVRATHGETRNEVLGSGDGSKPLQSFQLLQPPLTYLAAPVPSGNETTLQVRINDVLWSEADNLFALNANARKYITKTNDEAKTTVIFGDGEHGSRLPTGVENIKAVYRQGLGKGGNVKAEQIKLPLTKPLGVKSVINPLPGSGGVDKETRDQARRNAPIAVLALDRLVSVQDYADFARTFAGIAKASAQQLSDGEREVVHLTIAGAGNIPIDNTSDLYRNLLAALARFGDPLQPVQVESFERVLLVVSAKVRVLPEYLWEKVKEQMRATLWDKLDFENRELGQDVTQSEVVSLMQSVPGVDYVDFELLDSISEDKLKDPNFATKLTLRGRVRAELARMDKTGKDILPAQLVYLSREAVDTLILEEIPV